MGKEQVTPAYVDIITNGQYKSRTSNTAEFEALRDMLASAWLTTNRCYLPDRKFTHGLALLIAHYYTTGPKDVAGGGGSGGSADTPSDSSAGPVTSERVGDISITYGAAAASSGGGSSSSAMNAWLGESTYGRQFMALMHTFKPHPVVT